MAEKGDPMAAHADTEEGKNWHSALPVLCQKDFDRFSEFIYRVCGINLSPAKKTMLAARLQKRLRRLQLDSFADYFDYVMSPVGQEEELGRMIDVVSTNKTDFFREPKHFEILLDRVLPELLNRMDHAGHKLLRVWSAGCSSGEEPYTLAMVLEDFFSRYPGLDYTILATDICTEVLARAEEAVYADDALAPVPKPFLTRYLMRGKGSQAGFHRVVPELRRKVQFRRVNFMEDNFAIKQKIDIIFCRNVIIYFDRKTQAALFEKFYRQMSPRGYLFIGHSETLEGIVERMERLAAAVYQCRR